MNINPLFAALAEALIGFIALVFSRIRKARQRDEAAKNDPRLSLILAREMTHSAQITRLSQMLKKYSERTQALSREVKRLEVELKRLKAEIAHLQNEVKNERF